MLCTGDNGSVPSRTRGSLHLFYFTHSWFCETVLLAVCQETFVTGTVSWECLFLCPFPVTMVSVRLAQRVRVCLFLSAWVWPSGFPCNRISDYTFSLRLVDTEEYLETVSSHQYLSVTICHLSRRSGSIESPNCY